MPRRDGGDQQVGKQKEQRGKKAKMKTRMRVIRERGTKRESDEEASLSLARYRDKLKKGQTAVSQQLLPSRTRNWKSREKDATIDQDRITELKSSTSVEYRVHCRPGDTGFQF